MNAQTNKNAEIVTLQLEENGNFPNNSNLPVLLYKNAFDFAEGDPASTIEKVLAANNWNNSWRNGIFSYQHYHSNAHEALGVYSGWAEVQLGGPGNEPVRIEKGDLVVLPAGTAHKRIDSGGGFAVVGAYPDGQRYDMNYGEAAEKQEAVKNIRKVPLPSNDPLFGAKGKMFEFWK
ncbi:cupin domain-containing protein [Tangfeifania diversioriginum]|nr:cupin domain-containing protein [Tangfeifania diversioriginum]